MFVFFVILGCALILYLLTLVIFYIIQERLIFVANLIKKEAGDKVVSEHEDIIIYTPSKGSIHGMLIKSEQSKGVIIYFHGNTGSLYKWGVIAEELTHYGYDVFPFDYRGYGRSTGKRSEDIMHRDAQNVYDFIVKKYGESKVFLYGRSLGSGFAVKLASENNPRGLILETPFDHFSNVADYHFPFIPHKLLLNYKFENDRHIKMVQCPILILHGTRDRIVPFKLAVNLFEQIPDDVSSQLITIPRGRHNNLASFALFREKINEFLNK